MKGFVISVLFALAAAFLSQERHCHIYCPHYVIDDTVLLLQLSAHGNSVSFVDAAELFTGCDTKLPAIQ